MPAATKERNFEDEVIASLVEAGGWLLGTAGGIDLTTGINPSDLLAFVRATQPDKWDRYLVQFGGDASKAQAEILRRVARETDARGTVDMLRQGVKDRGVKFDLCYFKPAHGLTPELEAKYQATRLTVTRQQRYNGQHTNTIDLCLWVNGLAVATVELKNPLTNQSVQHAMDQYRKDRDPKDPFLSRRAVVHFAVDPFLVYMTTLLAGPDTYFLPFNQGVNGRKGNPVPSPGKHPTAYLWEQVWQRDAWLDILRRFVDDNLTRIKTPTDRNILFPRYHQWDCVLKMEAHARTHGPGQVLLGQHSAGSGKSNSIAWLAYRLSELHDATDTKVFDKVIVITDRIVLDRQLQDTIYGFEHRHGLVEKIETGHGSKSQHLADALMGETARIVICTLQSFSHLFNKGVEGLGQRRYAVVVDEAHSSQTGEAAKDLKATLGAASEEAQLAAAEAVEQDSPDAQDLLAQAAATARQRQRNMSFFAFTATPKARTIEQFGTLDPATGLKRAFHEYSMRQAIEERFILDVLANYTTYETFYRIDNAGSDDPEVEKRHASAAIAKFVSLHPHNLGQKAQIIVDHFRAHTAHKIGGRAKAMVVTSSRLHAVRYKLAIDKYLAEKHISDVRAMVAFSGKVDDPDYTEPFTEPGMNKFPESETAARFRGDTPHDPGEYQVMIVAEKFQTGFDAPALHTMYVDKVLTGVAAVQTLSRLNRTMAGKEDTFVLDFRNDAEEIREAFRPFYDVTEAVPTDPNLLYDAERAVRAPDVIHDDDLETYWRAFAALPPGEKGNAALNAALAVPLARFDALDDENAEEFRDALDAFVRLYSFLSQVVTFTDPDLEKLYVFTKGLRSCLPPRPDGSVDLGSHVELTHLRIEKEAEVNATLAGDDPVAEPLIGHPGGGRGPLSDPETEHLSEIIARINERHGLTLSLTDAFLFAQYEGDWTQDAELAAQARANSLENFALVFDKKFFDTIFKRMDANEAIFKMINDDPGFADSLREIYLRRVYDALRA